MKKLSLLIYLFLFTECKIFFPKISVVRIQNDSNYNLKILAFGKKQLLATTLKMNTPYIDTIFLDKGKFIEKEPRNLVKGTKIFFDSVADSIVVVFDSKKILIQSCNGLFLEDVFISSKCNIINNLNNSRSENVYVENFKSGRYDKRTTYKITNDDYDRAVPFVK